MRTMDKISWSCGSFVMSTSKRWGWQKFQVSMNCFQKEFQHDMFLDRLLGNFHNKFQDRQPSPSNYLKLIEFETHESQVQIPPLFPPTKYAMIPQHGMFSLHTMLEGPWLHKTTFSTPMVRPLDESQRSSPLQGHGYWLMCELALRASSMEAARPKNMVWIGNLC